MNVFIYELSHFDNKRLIGNGPFGSRVCLLFSLLSLLAQVQASPLASTSVMYPVFAGKNSRCLVLSQIFSLKVELAHKFL